MATKHTPGPWQTAMRQGDDWDSVVCLPDRVHEICQCFHRGRSLAYKEECEANANLIAAAPEMYDALKQAKEFVEDLQLPDAEWGRVLDLLVATIAKAEGR